MKQKTLCLLLTIAITTGCSNNEQITVSNLTNTNEASIEASLDSTADDYEYVRRFVCATDEDILLGGCWFVEENKPREYSIDESECEPIDETADCEAILLEKADRLYTLIHDYLNNGSSGVTLINPYKLRDTLI